MGLIYDLLYFSYKYEVTAILNLFQELLELALYNNSDKITQSFLLSCYFISWLINNAVSVNIMWVNNRTIIYVEQ
jgi:hypothetical protein